MRLKVPSAKWRPFCLGLNVLRTNILYPCHVATTVCNNRRGTCKDRWNVTSPTPYMVACRYNVVTILWYLHNWHPKLVIDCRFISDLVVCFSHYRAFLSDQLWIWPSIISISNELDIAFIFMYVGHNCRNMFHILQTWYWIYRNSLYSLHNLSTCDETKSTVFYRK